MTNTRRVVIFNDKIRNLKVAGRDQFTISESEDARKTAACNNERPSRTTATEHQPVNTLNPPEVGMLQLVARSLSNSPVSFVKVFDLRIIIQSKKYVRLPAIILNVYH